MPREKKKKEEVDAVIYEPKKKKTSVKEEKNHSDKEIVLEQTSQTKPYFFPRLIAYIIDILLVSLVCSGVLFLIPKNENYQKYMKEYEQIQADFISENITYEEYFNKSVDVIYDIDYNNVISMILEILFIILYFVVFQFYNKGQTFGKRLMKLRVVSVKEKELTLNQMVYRALIINSIFINLLILASLLFLGRSYYYYASASLQFLAGGIVLVTLFMILFRKDGRGLHDVVAGTKVIQEN